jgi:arylsulfatase A
MTAGIYGDQVNEMSWAVGQILDTVRELGMARDTLALFTSDHGPHREIGFEGGSTGLFSGDVTGSHRN